MEFPLLIFLLLDYSFHFTCAHSLLLLHYTPCNQFMQYLYDVSEIHSDIIQTLSQLTREPFLLHYCILELPPDVEFFFKFTNVIIDLNIIFLAAISFYLSRTFFFLFIYLIYIILFLFVNIFTANNLCSIFCTS